MGFLDKAKAAVEQGAAKAKDAAGDVQQKRDLSSSYTELGKTAFDLMRATFPESSVSYSTNL